MKNIAYLKITQFKHVYNSHNSKTSVNSKKRKKNNTTIEKKERERAEKINKYKTTTSTKTQLNTMLQTHFGLKNFTI